MSVGHNPVVAELSRGDWVESVHRGAWVVADTTGAVVAANGDEDQLVFARSSTKSVQALPFIESGAADALGATDVELAVAIASHTGEPIHVAAATSLLARAGLTPDALQCGPQRPAASGDDAAGERITNNCSGKHAAFLATAVHLGEDPARYLDPDSKVQQLVRAALLEMAGVDPTDVDIAIDGCSAPTFRLPLRGLATGLARMANPGDLAVERADACRCIVDAGTAHPELVGGNDVRRFDTEVMRATDGRLFAKTGAEGIQTIGVVGAGIGLAAKIDDGSSRVQALLVLSVLRELGHLTDTDAERLAEWLDPVRRNFDGLAVGRTVIDTQPRPTK